MAILLFSKLSSTNIGTRDVAVGFPGLLETSETITTFSVTSSDTNVLTIANEAVNTAVIATESGDSIAIGKGIQFQLTTAAVVIDRKVIVDIVVKGNSGTKETYEVIVPIVDKLRA